MYSDKLRLISNAFGKKKLSTLINSEIEDLIFRISDVCGLTHKNEKTKIDGFSVSYLSALLHSYFPNLIPIIDRRILINMGIVGDKDKSKQKQIINIEHFYEPLIIRVAAESKRTEKTIEEIDCDFFSLKIID